MRDQSPRPGEPVRFSRDGVWRGFKQTAPLDAGGIAYGIVFGVLAAQRGLLGTEAVLMSVLVYSGSGQVAALDLWHNPLPYLAIWLATVLVSVRYLVLGAALRPWLGGLSPRKVYPLLVGLADQGWAMALADWRQRRPDAGFLLGTTIALMLTWVLGTIIGVIAGGTLPDPARWGLDLAPTLIFVILLPAFWRGRQDLLPWVVAGVAAIVTQRLLAGPWHLLAGTAAGVVILLWQNQEGATDAP